MATLIHESRMTVTACLPLVGLLGNQRSSERIVSFLFADHARVTLGEIVFARDSIKSSSLKLNSTHPGGLILCLRPALSRFGGEGLRVETCGFQLVRAAQVRKSSVFLRTLPAFVKGFVYEITDGESRHNVVTTAVWKDEDAFRKARKSAAEEFQRIGFDPPEVMKKLKVEIERIIYRRSPY
jgi:hypothetical protein